MKESQKWILLCFLNTLKVLGVGDVCFGHCFMLLSVCQSICQSIFLSVCLSDCPCRHVLNSCMSVLLHVHVHAKCNIIVKKKEKFFTLGMQRWLTLPMREIEWMQTLCKLCFLLLRLEIKLPSEHFIVFTFVAHMNDGQELTGTYM